MLAHHITTDQRYSLSVIPYVQVSVAIHRAQSHLHGSARLKLQAGTADWLECASHQAIRMAVTLERRKGHRSHIESISQWTKMKKTRDSAIATPSVCAANIIHSSHNGRIFDLY